MKIAAYAIAKNEAHNAREWYDNVRDADGVYVLDTGSGDGTVEKLRGLGCVVETRRGGRPAGELINLKPGLCRDNFRFDVARNTALAMVPDDVDVCVAVDLDQRLSDGWRDALEREWIPDATHGRFVIHWSPGEDLLYHHIHARRGAEWRGAVHEQVRFDRPAVHVMLNGLEMWHKPDTGKPRNYYLELAKIAAFEEPDSIPARFFYARALFNAGRYGDCRWEFRQFLKMKGLSGENVMKAWLYIAECDERIAVRDKKPHEIAEVYADYRNAINAWPHIRDPFLAFAEFAGRQGDFAAVYLYAKHSLTINNKSSAYGNPTACFGW